MIRLNTQKRKYSKTDITKKVSDFLCDYYKDTKFVVGNEELNIFEVICDFDFSKVQKTVQWEYYDHISTEHVLKVSIDIESSENFTNEDGEGTIHYKNELDFYIDGFEKYQEAYLKEGKIFGLIGEVVE